MKTPLEAKSRVIEKDFRKFFFIRSFARNAWLL